MQAASAQSHHCMYLPFRKVIHSFSRYPVFTSYSVSYTRNPKHTPLVLLALLLLALPSLLTLQKLVELPLLGERSHQLLADIADNLCPYFRFLNLSLSLFIAPDMSFTSLFISAAHSSNSLCVTPLVLSPSRYVSTPGTSKSSPVLLMRA